MTELGREPPPERGLFARIAVDIRPLRESRDFRRLWFGTGISAIGSQITTVAVPFQLWDETHSTVLVGLLGIAALVPLLIVPIYGGAVADAVDRRRMLLVSDVALMLVTAGLLANALQDVVFTLARVVGPALAGVLIGTVGLAAAFGIDIATFGASLIAIWLLPSVPPAPDAGRPSLQSILDGFRLVRRRKVLLGIFVVDTNAMIFGMPRSLLPAFADKLGGGPSVLGLMYAAPFAGALGASLTAGWMMTVRRQGLGVCVAASAWGAAIALVGLAGAVWVALVLLAFAGAADFISAVLRSNILLTATPDAMRGRLSGIELAQVAGAPELGNVEAGIVASLTSVRASIVSGGILTVAGTVAAALALPAFVRYDARRPHDE